MKKKKNRKNVLKLIAANTLEKAIYSIFNNNDDELQKNNTLPVVAMKLEQSLSNSQKWNSIISNKMLYFNKITR